MDTRRKWILGCGIGCGVSLLLLGALVGGGVWLVTRLDREFSQVERGRTELVDRFGDIHDYVPPANGALPAERVRAFLEVRALTADSRGELSDRIERLAEAEGRGGFLNPSKGLGMLRAGVALLPTLARYVRARDEALLGVGMGPGEYLFVYTVAFLGADRHDVASGPPFLLLGDEDDHDRFILGPRGARDRREHRLRRQLHRNLLPMLEAQLDGLEVTEPVGEWRQTLEREVDALRSDVDRVAWEDGLPPPLSSSLAPFRTDLESTWSAVCNPVELETEF